ADRLICQPVGQIFPFWSVGELGIIVWTVITSWGRPLIDASYIDVKSLVFRCIWFIPQMPFSGKKGFVSGLPEIFRDRFFFQSQLVVDGRTRQGAISRSLSRNPVRNPKQGWIFPSHNGCPRRRANQECRICLGKNGSLCSEFIQMGSPV